MIAMAITGLILSAALVLYATSTYRPYQFNEIITEGSMHSIPLQPFTSLTFDNGPINPIRDKDNGRGEILIISSDSVTTPSVLLPEELTHRLSLAYENHRLTMSFIPLSQEKSDSDGIYREIVLLTQPIIVLTPQMPDTIVSNLSIPLSITGHSDKQLSLMSGGNLKFINTSLAKVTINGFYGPNYRRNFDAIFDNATIDSLTVKDFRRAFLVTSDIASEVGAMTLFGATNYNQEFNPGNLKIDNFTFYPADSTSRITLTDSSRFTSSFNASR